MGILRKIVRGFVSVFTAFFLLAALLLLGWAVAESLCERSARILPSYGREDISALLEKERLSDEDYALLYRQTGLSQVGVDAVVRDELLLFQDALFFGGKVVHEHVSPITPHDILTDPTTNRPITAPIVPLQKGDILVTSTCHTFGWRHGHAALVTGKNGALLEGVSLGYDSEITANGDIWFRHASNFMVLRLKNAAYEERAQIATAARSDLLGVPYSLFVGFFSPKDQCAKGRTPTSAHCSQLVWQAYRNAGYDIDCNGGRLVSTRDIARSPLLEVVQVYGFDPERLW